MSLTIQIHLLILKTYYGQFTLTTKYHCISSLRMAVAGYSIAGCGSSTNPQHHGTGSDQRIEQLHEHETILTGEQRMPPTESADHEYRQTRFERRHSAHSCAVYTYQQQQTPNTR